MLATVTDVVAPHARSKRRIIHVDGEAWRTTSSDALRDLDIQPGAALDVEALETRLGHAENTAARERALRVLEHRDRSAADLTRRLADDGYPRPCVDGVVSRLVEVGVVDDMRYAQCLVRSLAEGKQFGRRRISDELRRRGVPDDVRDSILAGIDDSAEDARALAHAERQVARCDDPRKAVERLARRGFSWETASRAVERACNDAERDSLDPL